MKIDAGATIPDSLIASARLVGAIRPMGNSSLAVQSSLEFFLGPLPPWLSGLAAPA
jgi:hypothetical protein